MTTPAHPRTARRPARLDRTAVTVLESLYQHRVLSTVQIQELHAPQATQRWAQQILDRLRRARLADRVHGPHGLGLWHLTDTGRDAAESIPSRAETRRKRIGPEQAAGPLQQHTLAVNWVGITFVRAARN